MNKNLTTKQNTDLVLKKSKSTLNITSKILSGKTSLTSEVIEDWIKDIWSWADENGADSSTVPRNKNLLLALETIDLSGLELYSITSRLCFLEYVTTLILEDNNIEELPKEIVNFKNLKMLNLKNNPFTLTYTQKRWAEQLKDKGCEVYLNLDLIEKQNSDLIDESWMERLWAWADENNIPDYKWTEDINYKNSGYWEGLPRDRENLLKLTELDLWEYTIDSIPKEIGNMINLTSLCIGENYHITTLPKEIGKLINLKRLILWEGKLKSLPEEISNLSNLTNLEMQFVADLTSLPESIYKLTGLTKLRWIANTITLPKCIHNFPNLKCLALGCDNLEEILREIMHITTLT